MKQRCFLLVFVLLFAPIVATAAGDLSVTDFGSIQEAIDQNPGRALYVPGGDHEIDSAIRLTEDNSGLFGPGRILQTNPDQSILIIEGASNVQVRNLTLTRPEGKMQATQAAVIVRDSHNITLAELQVLDNHFGGDAVNLSNNTNCQVRNCLVQNYSTIAEDDRTAGKDWGFAFAVINGTGITLVGNTGTILQGNRIVELNNIPTPEIKEAHGLGKFTKRNPEKGLIVSQEMWDAQYYNAWHQGSALVVTSRNDYTQILGNYIENAAQGIDIHSDHVLVEGNIVNNAFIGMKAMHGSRNVLILGNQFSKIDLWAIGLMPGAGSHPAGYREGEGDPMEANVDAGHIIANNIISDFGYGNANWAWSDTEMGRYPIRLDVGQKPMNPPLRDVIVSGNVVYDTGRDQVLVDGEARTEPPRYDYAIFVNPGETRELGELPGPVGIHFSNNVLHTGTEGVSNVELQP